MLNRGEQVATRQSVHGLLMVTLWLILKMDNGWSTDGPHMVNR
jgi:hypothetical protein